MKSNPKVLFIAVSPKNKGGITTVLKLWQKMPFWNTYKCKWLATQTNENILQKLLLLFSAYLKAIFIIPAYDIIHFHSTPGICAKLHLPFMVYAKLWRKKTVVHIHVGNQMKRYVNDASFNIFMRMTDKVIVLAKVWKILLVQNYNLPDNKVGVIYNPSPDISDSYIHPKKPYFLYLAYMVHNKGYDILIKAFAKATKNNPDWKLIMCGAGETDKARSLINQLGLDSKVIVYDWVEGDMKHELFKYASAYCMTSYEEGWPMCVLEAFAYGTPLITTPVGGTVDVIENEKNSLVFDFGDAEGLSVCMKKLMYDPKLIESLSAASFDMAKNTFSTDLVNNSIIDIYQSLFL